MLFPLTSLFALYTLTPGRRIYSLNGVRKLVVPLNLVQLTKVIDAAITHDRQVLDMDAQWRARKAAKSSPVRAKDNAVDRVLTMIDRLLSHYAQDEDNPGTAAALLATLFPVGVTHHTRLTFVEQAAANERVLAILEADTHAKWLNTHGLHALIEELRAAHDVFAATLRGRNATNGPSWDDVKAGRENGQEMYLQVVANIIVHFAGDLTTRSALLEPIWDQNEEIKAYRRQRRALVDVDPDSGEPLEEDEDGEEGEQADQSGDDAQAEEAADEPPADA